ncbi:MAG: argininosuccinate lyase [Rhodobacteraceae bacterium]|nr:argininosuccinate lyase [Paracoccaceae bacterium]
MKQSSKFPDPVYRETVLAPAFDHVKAHFADYLHSIDQAHLVMLRETGILSAKQAAVTANALAATRRELDIDKLSYTGEFEDYFFLVEAEHEKRHGTSENMLHLARSRNDIDHTAFRLALMHRADEFMETALSAASAMVDKAQQESATLVVAYTHGQPAQPSTFGHYLAAAIEVFARDAKRLDQALDDLDRCPMGAAAITGSGFPIDRQRVSNLLGFREPAVNTYGCIAAVDHVTGLYSAVKLIFLHLGRLIQDLFHWSSFEVGQLRVSDGLVQVSSIMPQKRNPVAIEHLRHMASVSVGYCDTVLGTMHNTPFTDMNDSEAEVQHVGLKAFGHGGRTLRLLEAVVAGCSIDAFRAREIIEASCITVTELADTLVRDCDIGFRQAHGIASATARKVIQGRARLVDGYEEFKEAFAASTGRTTEMSAASYAAAVWPRTFVERRNCLGGPAPEALEHGLKNCRESLRELGSKQAVRQSRRARAALELNHAFASLL